MADGDHRPDEPDLGNGPTPGMVVAGRTLADPRLSPDGTAVVVHVRDGAGPRLVCIELGDGEQVTPGPETVIVFDPSVVGSHPFGGGTWNWFPDSGSVVYVAAAGLFRAGRAGGPGQLLATPPLGTWFASPTASADGRRIAVIVENDDSQSIAVVDLGHDGSLEIVVPGDPGVFCMDPAWSPDGALSWHRWEAPFMPWDRASIVTRKGDGSVSVLGDGSPAQPQWSADGMHLGHVADGTNGWRNVCVDGHAVVGAGAGEPYEHGTPSWGPGQRSWCWSPDGTRVAFVRNEEGFARLGVADVTTGAVSELGKAWHVGLSWSRTSGGRERIAAIRTGGVTPPQLVVYDLAVAPMRTTVLRGSVGGWEAVGLPEPEVFHWPAADGTVLHGRFYSSPRPHGGTIVSLHGGPTDQTTVVFNPRFGYWLARGWSVFVPDHRGSTGWGHAYQQAMNERWGELDVSDCADGLRALGRVGRIVHEQTVVIGGSAGGFCALHLLLRHPELFSCGVALYPVTDLAELDATTHRFERFYNRSLVGSVERYGERSPITVAATLSRPLLLLHGDADPVVSVGQSRRFAAEATAAGATVELVVYEGEVHSWKRSATTVDELLRIDAFLARFCPTG